MTEETFDGWKRRIEQSIPPEVLKEHLDTVCTAIARYLDADALLRYKDAFPEYFQSFEEKE